MDSVNESVDSVAIETEKIDIKSSREEQSSNDTGLSKRELKRIKKREKWLERKPAKRYVPNSAISNLYN